MPTTSATPHCAEVSADGEDGPHDRCDDQRTEPPERRGEETCPLGIRQLEEVDEGQPDPLEQRIDAPVERDAPAWITGLDEVEHEPERPGCETRRSGSRKRPPARPRLAREHERGEDRQRVDDRPFRADAEREGGRCETKLDT